MKEKRLVSPILRTLISAGRGGDYARGVTYPVIDLVLTRTNKRRNTVIYELHVGGFTKSPTSGVTHPGTFSGIIEKFPYLKGLGVTAVELLPVMDFDEKEVMRVSPMDGKPLTNFWGYGTHSYFAPQCAYCILCEEACHLREFRDRVKALHNWDDPNSRALGSTLAGFEQDPDIHVMMNMYWEPLDFELLSVPGRSWFRSIDTALLPPDDISHPGAEVLISGNSYLVTARSVVVLGK
jgi:pullulanase/glycogen debranching enzyme